MIILKAIRPKTLTASAIPVLVGTALAAATQRIDLILALYALLCALCIQIATNLINDALDFKKGADTKDRIGPVRVTQMGLLTPAQVLTWGFLFLALAAFFGIPLVIKGGIAIASLLGVSLLLAYFYTGGPYPLAYNGLGDIFVVIFFGLIATGGACYIQTFCLTPSMILSGVQIGLLATLLLAINNLRDHVGDAKAGKKTLVVRFGIGFGRAEITICTLIPFILNLFWIPLGYYGAGFLPLMTFPLAMTVLRFIWMEEPSPAYNKMLGLAALLHLSFGMALASGLQLS